MAFEDFTHYFSHVNICFLHPALDREWEEQRAKGSFQYKPGTRHPVRASATYELIIPADAPPLQSCWVSVHQEDERKMTAKPYIDLAVVVLAADPANPGHFRIVKGSTSNSQREIQLQIDDMRPGTYTIVPITSGVVPQHFAVG